MSSLSSRVFLVFRVASSQGLWILGAPKPGDVLASERRGIEVPVRSSQASRTGVPGTATDHFEPTRWRSCRAIWRAILVVVIVIPVADPFPNIPGHVIDPIGTFAGLQRPHRH